MKKNIFILVALFVSVYSFGQGEIDAFRISKNDLSGTARGQAMGGAFGALGGDVTGIAINPAGIGIYRSSEVIFNAGLTFNQSKANFEGMQETKGNTSFTCDNFAYVGYYPLGNDDDYSLNFGFNYSRIKNFDRKYKVSGRGMSTSLTDYMVHNTNGTPHDFFSRGYNRDEDMYYANGHPRWIGILGWNSYLINPEDKTNDKYVSILNDGEKVDPDMEVREKGAIGAYDFTLGANLNNKVYLGTTVTYTDISYVANTYYGEKFADGGGFNLENNYNTEGSGFQVKLGAIFKPVDALRLGVSFHSPTWYTLTDYYQGTLFPDKIPVENGSWAENTSTPNGAYQEYKFRTPDVWTISAATVIGQIAVISLDYEYKNYSHMTFSGGGSYDFRDENGNVKNHFKSASSLRLGTEIRLTPQLSGRLGCAWVQNPYKLDFKDNHTEVMTIGTIPNYTIEGDANYITAGVGYRFTPQFYIDLAFVYRSQKDELHYFSPLFYSDTGEQFLASSPAKVTNSSIKGLVTLGYKFSSFKE